jgi:hypothetical protein
VNVEEGVGVKVIVGVNELVGEDVSVCVEVEGTVWVEESDVGGVRVEVRVGGGRVCVATER